MDASELTTLRMIATQYCQYASVVGPTGTVGPTGFNGPTGPTGASSVALNYVQVEPAPVVMANGASLPFTIASLSITTSGNPVQLTFAVDMNALGIAAYTRMQFYRNSTGIGQTLQAEPGASAGSGANITLNATYIDTPAAGTYTYSYRVIGVSSGGNAINFGEISGPTFYAIEMASGIGIAGPTGPTASGITGPTGITGPMGSTYPIWTNLGNIVFGGTTSIPTASINAAADTLSYRQIGLNQWEISMIYQFGSTAGLIGSGDYLFTLPNSLSFDTSQPMQIAYQGNVITNSWTLAKYSLPAGGVMTNGSVGGQASPIIWSATEFRVLIITSGTTPQCWGSTNYPLNITTGGINMKFQFTST
jgi:hypothetical protein